MVDVLNWKMIKCVLVLTFCIATSYGESTTKPILCGEIPNNILQCLNNPQTDYLKAFPTNCRSAQSTECDVFSCAFRQRGWMNGYKLNRTELVAHFTQFSKDNPDVKSVIDHVVPTCLERDLPVQGVYINCPAYDVMHCILISYIQKSPASKWVSSPACAYARQFASACPVCPSGCFAPVVPYGSCNACYGLPAQASNTA